MSESREVYIKLHVKDALVAIIALEVAIEKGLAQGMTMTDERFAHQHIRSAVEDR